MSSDPIESGEVESEALFPHFGQEAHLQGIRGWGIQRVLQHRCDLDGSAEIVEDGNSGVSLVDLSIQVAECRNCDLCKTRNRTAFGVGAADADLMFVGEAPGQQEDLKGEPFVGPAGQLLNRMIGAMGLERDQVYIANVLKCRPPENRDPRPPEVAACSAYLKAQIELVRPKILVALGRPAACWLTGQETALARLRGKVHDWHGIPVIATYHPAYLLRQEQYKADCWQDLQEVIGRLGLTPASGRS
ncbi:MAG: uracil-DNA glycosylase [Planctomycetota bacterium]